MEQRGEIQSKNVNTIWYLKRKEMPKISQSVTVRTFNKEGQTFLIELRNWIWSRHNSPHLQLMRATYIFDTIFLHPFSLSSLHVSSRWFV